ncbi:MAG: InlB B-repeat-containing protein, partial [Bacilli bacterium]|nr:InlB B-repeat-containing protein [Bacilli bacterium]
MKKFLALLLLLTLVFVGFACGEDKKEDDKKQDDNQQEEVKEFTVKFVADEKEVTKQTVKEGEKASKPADPVKEGYTFVGW